MKFFKLSMILKLEKNIKEVDKKYYAVLGVLLNLINQDKKIYQNITVSPLSYYKDNEYTICLSFFNEETYQSFLKYFNAKLNEIIYIDKLPFRIKGFLIPSQGQIFDLEIESKLNYPNYKGIKLNFISPTVVKHSPTYRLLPLAQYYIFSLLNRFHTILGEEKFYKFFEFNLTKKVKSLLEEGLVESYYKLEIEKVFIKGGYVPGNVGYITYSINKTFQEPVFDILKEKLPIFIKGAYRTGLGFGTRLGLGQVKGEIYL